MKFNLGGVFMFISNLFIPVLMIIFGKIFSDYPPKTIYGTYGYRTSMSKKNQDTWNFAHEYCGKLWWKIGWIISVPSLLIPIPFYGICSVFPTERALKEKFTDEGIRK